MPISTGTCCGNFIVVVVVIAVIVAVIVVVVVNQVWTQGTYTFHFGCGLRHVQRPIMRGQTACSTLIGRLWLLHRGCEGFQ